MAESAYTKGPWAVTSVSMTTGNVGVGRKDLRILIAEVTNAASFGDMLAGAMRRGGGGFDQSDCKTQFANAGLIAAAPDLVEALQAVDLARLTDLPKDWQRATDLTDAALRRALGKEG